MSQEKFSATKYVTGDRQSMITLSDYQKMYKESIEDSDSFWAKQASSFLSWDKKWTAVQDNDYLQGRIKWFLDGKLNVSYNCLDRHLEKRGDQIAIIWERDEPGQSQKITYRQLHEKVCKFANALKSIGVKKGDTVCIYLSMIPEAAVAMLACSRIGAVHSVVFGGFSSKALGDRIQDGNCKIVITADEGIRGGKKIPLKNTVDEAIQECSNVNHVIVIKLTNKNINWVDGRDIWYGDLVENAREDCPVEIVDSEDPLFILYTSGSTGRPKGVLHSSAGYLLYAAITHRYVFNYQDGDVYWCTADVGWITGHSYILYGPLCNGATTIMYEGLPTYPDASRFWKIVDEHKVTSFYTAPTAIRSLMSFGDDFLNDTKRSSLRVIGSVGEPINPEAWYWYHDKVGKGNCVLVDTWWQTETGGHLITPIPGVTDLKPGSATLPFFGILPVILDKDGKEIEGPAEGVLCIKRAWPGQMRTVYGDHKRFVETYLSPYPGYYFSGDGARRDEDGFYWITGRVDDTLNISGHRLGTAEIESAICTHPVVVEAAVVGYPHDIKGQGIYAYVTLVQGTDEPVEKIKEELIKTVRKEIGPIATPDIIQWAPGLPKTRSGKIMRRILRKIASNEVSNLGDTSTLADQSVVEDLISHRMNTGESIH